MFFFLPKTEIKNNLLNLLEYASFPTSLKLIFFFVYTNVCKTETKRIHLRLAPDNDAKETGDKYG